jgi:pyridoxal phosphate enzyme (YggS family)
VTADDNPSPSTVDAQRLADNLQRVRSSIDAACLNAGRDPQEVRLLPVSKTHPVDAVVAAFRAGARIVAENKVQEAAGKARELAERSEFVDLKWAMIGHLQTNKAKDVVTFADEFHALDSVRLAEALDRRLESADRTLDVFIEVNSSGEDSKFGVPPDEVLQLAGALQRCERLRPRGLMTIAANTDDTERVAGCFDTMVAVRRRLQDADTIDADYAELSMGMSGDYELAIARGATTVRIGTAIFGPRPQPR